MPAATLGRLQRGDPGSREFAIGGFTGLNVRDQPQYVEDHDLTEALNGYVVPSGGFRMRNGMTKNGTSIGSATGLNLARFYQAVKNGAAVAPVTKLLGQYNGHLYDMASNTDLGAIGGGSALPWTWVRIQNPNDPNFVAGLTDCIVICTGSGGPYVYDGTNLYTPAGWSAASGARWCAVVNGILWFGGISATPNQVFGTGDGVIASMEALPAYRNFVFSSPVTGLCAQGSGANASLVVGRSPGISVLYGTGISTFALQDVPFTDGVASGLSMCAAEGIVYFLGRNAVYAFDGQTEPRRVSDKVEPWILNDALALGYPLTTNRNLSWGCVFNNAFHLGYCSNSTTANVVLVLDLLTLGWTVLQTTPGIGSMILLDAPTDPSPFQAVVGSATTGQAYNWDVEPAAMGAATDDGVAFQVNCQSKFFTLGVPGTNKSLTRAYPDLFISGPLKANFVLNVDCGNLVSYSLVNSDAYASQSALWGSAIWGISPWGGAFSGFTRFGSPYTRVDFGGVQGDTFAFGLATSEAVPPWIFVGCSGVFQQRGRT